MSRTIEALRQESERSRGELSQTVSALRAKVAETSEHLKSRVSPGRLKREGLQKLRQSAMDNPVAAVAIGAAVAYPFLGFLRNLPVPILLIGTGLWMQRRRTQPEGGNDGIETEQRAAQNEEETATSARTNSLTQNIQSAKETLGDTGAAVAAKASDVAAKAGDLTRQSRTAVADLAESNPLMLAGFGLVAGAALASFLPATRAENSVLGAASASVRNQARSAGNRVIREAAEGAASTTSNVIGTADREIGAVLEETAGKLQSVIGAGVDAALKTVRNPDTQRDQ